MDIKEARKLAGFSLLDVSKMLGTISHQTISHIESGTVRYKPETEHQFRVSAASLYRHSIQSRVDWMLNEAIRLKQIVEELKIVENEKIDERNLKNGY